MNQEAMMDKQEAKNRLEELSNAIKIKSEYIELYKARISELRAIIDAPEPDPSKWVGKLCYFEAASPHIHILDSHYTKNPAWFPYRVGDRWYKTCRPATRAEVEALIYEEPEKWCCDTCFNQFCFRNIKRKRCPGYKSDNCEERPEEFR